MGWVENKLETIASTVVVEGERTRAELGATFAESLRGQRLSGALARPIRANAVQVGAAGRLVGWSLRGTSATDAAVVTFHDGRGPDADPVGVVVVPAGGSDTTAFPAVSFVDHLYVEVTGGTVSGAVWIGAVD